MTGAAIRTPAFGYPDAMSTTYRIEVDNVKCGGCARTIETALGALPGIERVGVEVATGRVEARGAPGLDDTLLRTLRQLGYPPRTGVS